MKTVTKYQNQKVLVLGLAKSGVSAAELLHKLGAFVTVNDARPLSENPEARNLLTKGVTVICGSHPAEILDDGFTLLVKNPGIPYENIMVQKAIQLHIPIITEVELAYQVAACPIIGITGTNGKTTTTTMIGAVLNKNRTLGNAILAGNIGLPASTAAQEVKEDDDLVVELSSFQLMGIQEFHPHIGVITNLYEAHLDYHGTRSAYVEAKWRIQQNMVVSDYLIINWDQSELRHLAQESQADIIFFSTKERLNGAYCWEGQLFYQETFIMNASELGTPGSHNIENALCAIAVGMLKGCTPENIADSLREFTGVAHRTEYVGNVRGRKFYNDSKATNILATEKAISGFDITKLILLAGGLDRGNGFDELIPQLTGLKTLIVFGETKDKLYEAGQKAGVSQIIITENAETAVPIAFKQSEVGDSILLSPACASWDQYPNFEVRGDRYKAAVKKLNEDEDEEQE